MPDLLTVAMEDVEHWPLCALRRLGEVVRVVGVALRGEQPQTAPAALSLPGRSRSSGDLATTAKFITWLGVLDDPIELVEQAHARRAWTFRQGQLRRLLLTHGSGPIVLGIAREHEAVDRQRVLSRCEQLREPHVHRLAVGALALEDVVLRDDSRRVATRAGPPRPPPSGGAARSPVRADDRAPPGTPCSLLGTWTSIVSSARPHDRQHALQLIEAAPQPSLLGLAPRFGSGPGC